jgi:hypothetical protein
MQLLVQKFFLCIGITYFSLFLSNLFISTLSYNYTLAFRLGQNLSNITRFILPKQKFPLILLYQSTKFYLFQDLYLFSLDRVSFLVQSFASQVVIKIWTRGQILVQKSNFSELPQNEQERIPHHHEPNATRFVSNRHREREIFRSVRIVKQAKKRDVDCAVHTVHIG